MPEVPEYTTICGVDVKHLEQLSVTWPTWKKNKPSILKARMLIFYDRDDPDVGPTLIRDTIDHPNLECHEWPPQSVEYPGCSGSKWTSIQRYKMLSGFVYMSVLVGTPYMLKLDTDVVAMSQEDWIDPDWFSNTPAFISHPWSFTKPADQMLTLDRWAEECKQRLPEFEGTEPLNIIPKPGAERVSHKRIISWCSFWHVPFVRMCRMMAARTCGDFKLPVPSQDGYLWYCAMRLGKPIVRSNMKKRGWNQWCTMTNIRKHAEEALL